MTVLFRLLNENKVLSQNLVDGGLDSVDNDFVKIVRSAD